MKFDSFFEDLKLELYLREKRYLPDFLKDTEKCTNIFRRIDEMVMVTKPPFGYLNRCDAQRYILDFFLYFMAAHGFTLQKAKVGGIEKFYNLEDTLQNYIDRMEGKENIPESEYEESLRYMEYMETAEFYPDWLKNYHRYKNVSKKIDEMVQETDLKVNWDDCHVYSGDFFLYFMAAHGYTLQWTEIQGITFCNIQATMVDWLERNNEKYAKM